MFRFFKKKEVKVNSKTVISPVSGTAYALDEVSDPVFAKKMVGDGFAMKVSDGELVSPFDGEISLLFPTRHAIGIRRQDGLEILLHIGIDTVQLDGKGFKAFCKQGDYVRVGQKLVQFDVHEIERLGYCSDLMVILTNHQEYNYELPEYHTYQKGDELLHVEKNKN